MSQSGIFKVRKAAIRDQNYILKCLAEAFEPYRQSYTPAAFLDTVLTPETLAKRMQSMTIFVGETFADEVIGTIACSVMGSEEGHLRGMAVRKQWQGSGVADVLLRQAEGELLARKCSRITLDTTPPLQRAMRFYERHGYQKSGRAQDFFGMPLFEYVKTLPRRER